MTKAKNYRLMHTKSCRPSTTIHWWLHTVLIKLVLALEQLFQGREIKLKRIWFWINLTKKSNNSTNHQWEILCTKSQRYQLSKKIKRQMSIFSKKLWDFPLALDTEVKTKILFDTQWIRKKSCTKVGSNHLIRLSQNLAMTKKLF